MLNIPARAKTKVKASPSCLFPDAQIEHDPLPNAAFSPFSLSIGLLLRQTIVCAVPCFSAVSKMTMYPHSESGSWLVSNNAGDYEATEAMISSAC